MKLAILIFLAVDSASTLASLSLARYFSIANLDVTALLLLAGIGLVVLGVALRYVGPWKVAATPKVQQLPATRTGRIVAREVNGDWSIEVSGDPQIAHDAILQKSVLEQLRLSGRIPADAFASLEAKLQRAGGGT